jgi:hypothetical protein
MPFYYNLIGEGKAEMTIGFKKSDIANSDITMAVSIFVKIYFISISGNKQWYTTNGDI